MSSRTEQKEAARAARLRLTEDEIARSTHQAMRVAGAASEQIAITEDGYTFDVNKMPKTLNEWGQEFYDVADEKGFHEPVPAHIGEVAVRLLLIISEICEAFEAIRKNTGEHDEEIADTIIRLLHYAAHEGVDIDGEVTAKTEKNKARPYKHGKLF